MSGQPLQIARAWLGTPYVHQSSVQGAGCDCLGLIRGIWRGLYGAEPCDVPPYTPDWGEAERRELLAEAALRLLRPKPLSEAGLGDVILFRMRSGAIAKHLGVQSRLGAEARFIHAYERHGVIESPLSAPWARRVAARFGWP